MRHLSLVVLPLFATACVFPNYKASKVVEYTLPADQITRLQCDSHNGDITVTGVPGATEIAVRAELSVRGTSQSEADSNLHLMEVVRDTKGDLLHVFGRHPTGSLNNRAPNYRFVLKVPTAMAMALESHNGDIVTTGMVGTVKLETHNGDIQGQARTNHVTALSHNGDVNLRIDGEGPLDGEITTHNGDIDLALAESLGTRLEASTHNGRVSPPAKLYDAAISRRKLSCSIGDGKGRLVVDTHNGDVVVR